MRRTVALLLIASLSGATRAADIAIISQEYHAAVEVMQDRTMQSLDAPGTVSVAVNYPLPASAVALSQAEQSSSLLLDPHGFGLYLDGLVDTEAQLVPGVPVNTAAVTWSRITFDVAAPLPYSFTFDTTWTDFSTTEFGSTDAIVQAILSGPDGHLFFSESQGPARFRNNGVLTPGRYQLRTHASTYLSLHANEEGRAAIAYDSSFRIIPEPQTLWMLMPILLWPWRRSAA